MSKHLKNPVPLVQVHHAHVNKLHVHYMPGNEGILYKGVNFNRYITMLF